MQATWWQHVRCAHANSQRASERGCELETRVRDAPRFGDRGQPFAVAAAVVAAAPAAAAELAVAAAAAAVKADAADSNTRTSRESFQYKDHYDILQQKSEKP